MSYLTHLMPCGSLNKNSMSDLVDSSLSQSFSRFNFTVCLSFPQPGLFLFMVFAPAAPDGNGTVADPDRQTDRE